MVDDIIAKIMEEERLEQMEKMKKRNESVEMMRQVTIVLLLLLQCSSQAPCVRHPHHRLQFMEDRERWKAEEVRRQQAEDDAINKCPAPHFSTTASLPYPVV